MPEVDIIGSMYPLPDEVRAEQWDEIRAVDCLEHWTYRETDVMLADWASVLAPGGRLFIQVPDAERIMTWFTMDPLRLVQSLPTELPQTPLAGATWRLLGGHADGERVHDSDDFRWNAHYAMFSTSSLITAIETAGLELESVNTNPFPNIQLMARKP